MVRRAFKRFVNFVRLMRHLPPDPKRRHRPDTSQVREAAKAAFSPRAGGAGGGATMGTRKTDKMISKAIADSHKKTKR